MFSNFFKTTIRHIQKHKLYTAINIIGLIIAFTCSLLIFLYVKYEKSYDRYHENADHIYRVITKANDEWRGSYFWNATSGKLKPTIIENIPEVLRATTFLDWGYEADIYHKGIHYREQKYFVADPEFMKIFSFPLLKGDPKTALNEPKSILLTESMAKQFFGKEDPMGKTISINEIDHTVTGILKDIPKNSHFTMDFLASFLNPNASTWGGTNQGGPMVWGSNNFSTYIQVKDDIDPGKIAGKITKTVIELVGQDDERSYNLNSYHLQKLTDIHLKSHINREFEVNGNILYIYIFSCVAILLLLIAGFNFMNLTTVQTLFFAKESGIRKISGANRKQVSFQFLGEALLFSSVAFLCSILTVKLLLPIFSEFAERELTFRMILNPGTFIILISTAIAIGILSGLYPAIMLAVQKPVNALKNGKKKETLSFNLRNSLVVFQFAISIVLIISSIIIFKQLNYIQKKDLGYQKENIVTLDIEDQKVIEKYNVFKDELLKVPAVVDVTCSQTSLDFNMSGAGGVWEGQTEDERIPFYTLYVDYNFLDFYGIPLIKGRQFSKNIASDKRDAYILNKTAIEAIGWDAPLNKEFRAQAYNGHVIGVVDDFHFQTLRLNIEPLAIVLDETYNHGRFVSVKIKPGNIQSALRNIEETYSGFSSGYPLKYSFLNDQLDRLYGTDEKLGRIFSLFTAIAIFVSIMGLFGLASFIAKQRTKEIGIRKVNGARETEVVAMLGKDFTKWVIIAFAIAVPVAWYAMKKWIENFAYKTEINWWVFFIGGCIALLAALLTVGWQSWNSAKKNPIEALRYE